MQQHKAVETACHHPQKPDEAPGSAAPCLTVQRSHSTGMPQHWEPAHTPLARQKAS